MKRRIPLRTRSTAHTSMRRICFLFPNPFLVGPVYSRELLRKLSIAKRPSVARASMTPEFNSLKDKLYSTAAHFGILRVSQRYLLRRDCYDMPREFKKWIALRIRPISSNDVSSISKKLNVDFGREIYDSDGGMVATIEDDIVHWSLFACSTYHHKSIEAKLRFYPDSAFIHNVYTVPEYRGLGIAPRVIDSICQYLFLKGKKKIYLTILTGNRNSINSARKAGFQEFGAVTYVKILPLRLYRIEGNSKTDRNIIKEMILTGQKSIELLANTRGFLLLNWHRNLGDY